MNNIKQKLLNVQRDLKAPKSQTNKFGGYSFRSFEDILENVKPHLASNGLVLNLIDEIVQIGNRIYVKATARLSSVDSEETIEVCAFAREPEDKKGSDQSQITGAASSYARKYSCNGLFCIDDTKDADATETHGKGAPELNKGTAPKPDSMVDKIVESFHAQTSVEGLEAKMNKARETAYAKDARVLKAYDDCMVALIK
jgi:hypothetical protein